MLNIMIYLLRYREAEDRRQKRLNKTHFKQISMISHNKKRLNQVWKLIQKIDVEIYEFGWVFEIQIKFGSLLMKLTIWLSIITLVSRYMLYSYNFGELGISKKRILVKVLVKEYWKLLANFQTEDYRVSTGFIYQVCRQNCN